MSGDLRRPREVDVGGEAAVADQGGAADFERGFGAGLLQLGRRTGRETGDVDDAGAVDRDRDFAQRRRPAAVDRADRAFDPHRDRRGAVTGQDAGQDPAVEGHPQVAFLCQLPLGDRGDDQQEHERG